jgi:CHASE1-domain containing sensor protein
MVDEEGASAQSAGGGSGQPEQNQQNSSQRSILRRSSSKEAVGNVERSTRISWVDKGPAIQPASHGDIPKERQSHSHASSSDAGSASSGGDGKKHRRSSDFLSFGGTSRSSHFNRRSSVDESSGGVSDDKKTRAVFCLRVVTIATLVAAAVAMASLTYVYVSRDEESNFSTQYKDSVVKVAEAFQQGLDVKTSSASTFAAMYTSRYGPQDTWPNVTMPNFAEQAEGQLDLCEGRALSFNPIITNETRKGWESFANASKDILDADPEKIQHVENGIFGRNPPAEGSRYPEVDVPVWQIAPIETNERAVMFNLHSEKDRMRALDDVIQYKVPALTAILQLVQDTDLRPSSILFYPVFDQFATVNDPDSHEVVGTISIVFSWDVVLASVLPAYIKGMICVIETTNGEVFTWSITGDTATLLGEGDLHDPKYIDQSYAVAADLEGTADRLGDVDYLITYKLTMYPSDEMRSQYITNRPAIYTTVIVLIFVCTAAIFLLYDYLVEHRQNKVMKAAARSTKIVEQMFPATFRERMFRDAKKEEEMKRAEEQQIRKANRERGSITGRLTNLSEYVNPKHRMKQFLVPKSRDQPDFNVPEAIATGGSANQPIADLFPDTSIMFCDIVGFTAWCAEHEPNQVFHLLETLYWEL